MTTRLVHAFSVSLMLMAECVSVPEVRYGSLEVVATDLTGERIMPVQLELIAVRGANPVRETTKGMVGSVQYGEYRLRVWAQGFKSTSLDVRIAQPETVVRVELAVGTIGCPPPPTAIG